MTLSGICLVPGTILGISLRYVFFESLVLSFYHPVLHVRKLRSWERGFNSDEVTGGLLLGLGYTPRWEGKDSGAAGTPNSTPRP